MNDLDLATHLADPVQTLGMSFYFDPLTGARAKEHGLNIYEFYGLGRGGTLGDVDTEAVVEAFTFFNPPTIDFLWTRAKAKADPVAIAADYVLAAYAFADRTFGALDPARLARVAAATRKVVDALPVGVSPLVDGYRQYGAPSDPVHGAYLAMILLRELRGGVHISAVREVELSALVACYLQDPMVFTLHGYGEDDTPEVNDDDLEKKRRAEALTDEAMARCFAVLSDHERDELAAGASAMFAALADPVPVAR